MNFTANIKNLTPEFRAAIEVFLPEWLESLLPYYEEAKKNGDDIMEFANVLGSEGTSYQSNGIDYYRQMRSGFKTLSFDGHKKYRPVNWRECFILKHPDFNVDPNPYMGEFCELSKNSMYFDDYVWRAFNRKAPYNDLNNKVDAYFKQLTGDDSVGFSLSNMSALYFKKSALLYINRYRCFD